IPQRADDLTKNKSGNDAWRHIAGKTRQPIQENMEARRSGDDRGGKRKREGESWLHGKPGPGPDDGENGGRDEDNRETRERRRIGGYDVDAGRLGDFGRKLN